MRVGHILKRSLAALGVDIRRLRDVPDYNLLGLRELDILTILDVGANVGEFSKFARVNFPEARIIAFEPLPDAVRALTRLAREDSKLEVVACALGDSDGEASIHWHRQHSPSSSLLSTTELTHELYPFTESQVRIPVPVRRLDSVIEERSQSLVPDILVKIDVQGFEGHVIRGGRLTLAGACACIVEVNRDRLYQGQASFQEVVNELSALGLQYCGNLSQVYGAGGRVSYFDAVFVRSEF